MNWDEVQGKWNKVKGKAKERWGELTDDELSAIDGRKDQLVGKLQEHYGYSKEKAEDEVKSFADQCSSC